MRTSLRRSGASIREQPIDFDKMPSPTGAKTLTILDLLAKHPQGLTSSEAVRASGITSNLVFRILKTLVAMDFAVQSLEEKRYTLSGRLLNLSQPRVGERSLTLCSADAMRALRDEIGETVQLVIETEGRALVLEQMLGKQALQVCGQVGMRIPLYSCAPGKAIMSRWSDKELNAWFDGRELKSYTKNTLSDRESLQRDLLVTSKKGYAVDRAEGIEGINCVAAPILDEYNQPLGAITIMAPIARLRSDRFEEVGQRCIRAVQEVQHCMRQS